MKIWEANFVQLNNLTVTDIVTSASGSYSVYATDANNNEVEVRVDSLLYPKINQSIFTEGKNFDILGNVTEFTYDGESPSYQIVLSQLSDITFNN